jgi:hypothetical protein
MPLKNLRYPDPEVEPKWNEAPRNVPQNTLSSENSSNASENSLVSLISGGRFVPTSWEPLAKNDFEIALVPRGEGTHLHRSLIAHRILLLPLTWNELLERARSVHGRRHAGDPTMVLAFGEVRVDFLTMEISRSGKPVFLTAKGFKLLRFFTQHPQQAISRDELLNEVWGYTNYPSTRTVDNHVCMLRKRLEVNPAHPIHFLTVHGLGYKFVP